MPTGISALLISEKYKFEIKNNQIIITTTISIVTIPYLIYLLK